MESSAYRSLAFLFSLGSLPVACNPKGGATTDGGTGGTDPTTGTTDGTGSSATDGATTEPTTGPTTTDPGGTTDTGDTTDTGSADEACQAYVAYLLRCEPGLEPMMDAYLAYCSMTRSRTEAVYGPACLALYDAAFVCLGTSECEDPSACEAEWDAADGCLPEAGAICVAFAAKEAECYGTPVPDYAAGACQAYLNYQAYAYGTACGTAYDEWYACLTELPCLEFQMRAGCDAQQDQIALACGGA
ncbi:hypothetical protein [Nannocystis bainbridge]|uniref:Uncharacterized protein n=1 Tax=Nannocystis bainbridge TaxID=2995303 RepID=A0ABT5DX68_9BACT|nr:hypothetical protein [Nannocystis bainbridge]MDC0718140.1 hypothetical protein [Nannocystis bainbridge]